MFHIDAVSLKATGPFKNVKFPIPKGLSVLYGLNRNASKHSKNSNGVGKSYLISSIPEILYENPVLGEKADRQKSGTRTLDLRLDDKKLTVERVNTKLNLKLNGKDTKLRTQPLRKERLAKMIPISEAEFNTYVYLDTRRPHPLIMGSSTERRKFFESFFALDKMNVEKKLIQQSLQELGRTRAAYDALMHEHLVTKESVLDKEQRTKLQDLLSKESVNLALLKSKNTKLQEISRITAFYEMAKTEINTVWRANNGDITDELYQELIKNNQWSLKHNEAGLKDALAYEQWQLDTKAHEMSTAKLSSEAKALLATSSLPEAIAACRKAKERGLLAKQALNVAREKLGDLDLEKPDKVEKATGDEESLKESLVALKHKLKHAEQFDKGICETCGQSVEVADKDKLRRSIKTISATLESIANYKHYKLDFIAWKDQQLLKEKAEARVALLKDKFEGYKVKALLLPELLAVAPKPEAFTGKKYESSVKERLLEEDKVRERLLKFLEPHVEMIIAYQNLTDKQKEAGKLAEKLQEAIIASQEICAKLESRIEAQQAILENLKRQRQNLKQYEESLKDEKNIRLILQAYDDRAMKRLAIESISSRLIQTINTYSKMVFPEDYRFEFSWSASQLSFLVHRMVKVNGKTKPDTSDIRKLSGAESTLFSLILIIALLSFVPSHKRCNVLILDEATANLSEENQQAMGEMLKVMLTIIPSIILVTPRNSEMYEGANNFTVVKANGQSTIHTGHPSQVQK